MVKHSQIKEDLLEAGETLFSEHGYHGTGIKDIVDAMGIPKGSFYNYFKSKEDFAAEIVLHYADRLSLVWEKLIARGPDDDPYKMLRNVFETMIRSQEGCQVKTGCLIGNLSGELAESSELCRAALQTVTMTWCDRVAHHLRRAQMQGTVRRDIDAAELARFSWNVWEGGLLRMKIENSTRPIRQATSLLFDVFLKPQ